MSGSNIYSQEWPGDNAKSKPKKNSSVAGLLQLNIEYNTIVRRKKVEGICKAWIAIVVNEYIQVESTFQSNAHGDEAWQIRSTGTVHTNYEEIITLAPTTQII